MFVFNGLTVRTVLEIYNHPNDLTFSIWEKDGRWGFTICRGEEGRYKPILTNKAVVADPESAAIWLEGLLNSMLESLRRGCIKEQPKERLDSSLVVSIREELIRSHTVDTSAIFAKT